MELVMSSKVVAINDIEFIYIYLIGWEGKDSESHSSSMVGAMCGVR